MLRRATPKSAINSRISPPYSTGNGMSLVVRALRVLSPSESRAKAVRASRWAGSEASA